jgi:cell division septation protein DedD
VKQLRHNLSWFFSGICALSSKNSLKTAILTKPNSSSKANKNSRPNNHDTSASHPKQAHSAMARVRAAGSALSNFVLGMVAGLGVALVVALFITRTELPFSGENTQGSELKVRPTPGNTTPDPNKAIYNKANADAAPPQEEGLPTAVIDQSTSPPAPISPGTSVQPTAQIQYFLQLGSFRNRDDAEQLKAQLAMSGTESETSVAMVNGVQVNRVRVGPFNSANDAYKARAPLTKSGFEAAVVKD